MIDMDSNKVNKFLLITTILSVSILLIGATFSYFTVSNKSKLNAVSVSAGRVQLGLGVSDMTAGIKLIPTRDEDIMTAYKHNCIDDNGYGACNVFSFSLSNFSKAQDVTEVNPTTKNFKLVIWLSNLEEAQEKEDAGTYSAVVTYSSVDGSMLTGTVSGIKDNGD